MDSASMNRALWSAGIWAGTAFGLGALTGANITLYDAAMDGAVMGGSSYTSDYIHSMIGWQPTGLTSAVVTGAVFSGAQRGLRGSTAYTTNFVAGAANDFLVEWYGTMMSSRMDASE